MHDTKMASPNGVINIPAGYSSDAREECCITSQHATMAFLFGIL